MDFAGFVYFKSALFPKFIDKCFKNKFKFKKNKAYFLNLFILELVPFNFIKLLTFVRVMRVSYEA